MESAVILVVPEAEPLVGDWRHQGDPVSRLGVPAHVTLLFPFVPEPDVGVVEDLRWLFAGIDSFPLTFSRLGTFGEDVTFLAPDQVEQCRALTAALVQRWPGFPPYGGVFTDVTPHLTVISSADAELHATARATLPAGLPVQGWATAASLYVKTAGSWSERARLPLADGELPLAQGR